MMNDNKWGTIEWAQSHEFSGKWPVVCNQKRTKIFKVVSDAITDDQINIRSVLTQKRLHDTFTMAFVWGVVKDKASDKLKVLTRFINRLNNDLEVSFAEATSYVYDIPSGYWQATILIKKGQ